MEAHKVDSRDCLFMGESADAQEGVQSFLEKRPPQFKLQPEPRSPLDSIPGGMTRPQVIPRRAGATPLCTCALRAGLCEMLFL